MINASKPHLLALLLGTSGFATHGFHQPVLEVQKLSSDKELAASKNKLRVYSNPATAVITIQPDNPAESPLLISVLPTGRLP
jgi:hypothetical protein